MRDWRYYAAKTWMTTFYTTLIVIAVALVGVWVYLMVTDPTLRVVALMFIVVATIVTILNLLFKLTEWSEKILEEDKDARTR